MIQVYMKDMKYMTSGGRLQAKTRQIDWDEVDSWEDYIATVMEET